MQNSYVLIAERDPFELRSAEHDYELAVRLEESGSPVTLYLVQNGVLPAREGAAPVGLASAIEAGVRVLVDDFSLRERSIDPEHLSPGITPATVDEVLDALATGARTLWL